MKSKEDAIKISHIMKDIGKLAGIETVCVITNMDEPAGRTVRKFFRNHRIGRSIKRQYDR